MLNQPLATAIAIILIGQFHCVADEFPDTFISLLKPGMKAALPSVSNESQTFEFFVMTNDRFEMELDARRLDIGQLCSKYPAVEDAVKELHEKFAEEPVPRGQERIFYWSNQYTPVTIEHVGKNYVLLRIAEMEEARIAIPAKRISAIRWGFKTPTIAHGFSRTTD
jgi:hypothetical protein